MRLLPILLINSIVGLDIFEYLSFQIDNIFIKFGNALCRQKIGITMGTNCASLIADLFLFCYERYFMLSLSPDSQCDIVKAFNNTSIYLYDIINMDNPYNPCFARMVTLIYPAELTLLQINTSDVEALSLTEISLSEYTTNVTISI